MWNPCRSNGFRLSGNCAAASSFRDQAARLQDPDWGVRFTYRRFFLKKHGIGAPLPTPDELEQSATAEDRAAEVCAEWLSNMKGQYTEANRLLNLITPELSSELPIWESIVAMEPLAAAQEIRKLLSKIHASDQPNGVRNEGTIDGELPQPRPVVELRGVAQRPLVYRREVETLSEPRYLVIEALLAAGPDGMSKPKLEAIKSDAVKYLREISGLIGWQNAIRMAGKAYGRYSIVHE